jgi:hypothetical protein
MKRRNHRCLIDTTFLEDLIYQENYAVWWVHTQECHHCTQRALTYVLQQDDVLLLDRMLSWTNCNEYIIEIFLAACVYQKANLKRYLLDLWQTLFPKTELFRVFCQYDFETQIEKEFATIISQDIIHHLEVLIEIANILDIDMNTLYDLVHYLQYDVQ